MAEKDHKPGRPGEHGAAEPGLSRRRMLGVAGAGAAGLATGAFTAASSARAATIKPAPARPSPARAGTAAQPDGDAGAGRVAPGEPVVVHVANAYSGEVNIYAGTSHIKVHDPVLAARLRRAAG